MLLSSFPSALYGAACAIVTPFFPGESMESIVHMRQFSLPVPKVSGAAGGTAARGGGGDGGRRGRRQARCRRSGEGRYSDRAGRRQTAPHADAAPRRNPRSRKCAEAKRRVAASEAKRPKGPQGAACADPNQAERGARGGMLRGTPGMAAWHSVRMSRHGRGVGRARTERIPTVEAH